MSGKYAGKVRDISSGRVLSKYPQSPLLTRRNGSQSFGPERFSALEQVTSETPLRPEVKIGMTIEGRCNEETRPDNIALQTSHHAEYIAIIEDPSVEKNHVRLSHELG